MKSAAETSISSVSPARRATAAGFWHARARRQLCTEDCSVCAACIRERVCGGVRVRRACTGVALHSAARLSRRSSASSWGRRARCTRSRRAGRRQLRWRRPRFCPGAEPAPACGTRASPPPRSPRATRLRGASARSTHASGVMSCGSDGRDVKRCAAASCVQNAAPACEANGRARHTSPHATLQAASCAQEGSARRTEHNVEVLARRPRRLLLLLQCVAHGRMRHRAAPPASHAAARGGAGWELTAAKSGGNTATLAIRACVDAALYRSTHG
jgi:hypothetical protein